MQARSITSKSLLASWTQVNKRRKYQEISKRIARSKDLEDLVTREEKAKRLVQNLRASLHGKCKINFANNFVVSSENIRGKPSKGPSRMDWSPREVVQIGRG